jgi:hypothetical protein
MLATLGGAASQRLDRDAEWWWQACHLLALVACGGMVIVVVRGSVILCQACGEGLRMHQSFVTNDKGQRAHLVCPRKTP